MTKFRSCSEICIDADKHPDDLLYLNSLWNEVVTHKYSYPLVEIWFIREHLDNYMERGKALRAIHHVSF